MKNVSRWITLGSAVAVSIVAAGCGSESASGPSAVISGAGTGEQFEAPSVKVAALANTAVEVELVGYVKSTELIAIAASLAAKCQGCLEGHIKKALKSGATREEISESIAIAIGVNAAAIVDLTDIAADNLDLKLY